MPAEIARHDLGILARQSARALQCIRALRAGRGELSSVVRLTLSAGMSYHVNLYRGRGNELTDVVACASLKNG